MLPLRFSGLYVVVAHVFKLGRGNLRMRNRNDKPPFCSSLWDSGNSFEVEAKCLTDSTVMSSYRANTRVYIGDLGSGGSKPELEREFERYGPLKSVWVARNPPGKTRS